MFTVIQGLDMNKPQAKPKTRHSPVRQFLRHPLWAPLNQRSAWDRLATSINPLWSLMEARARVLKIVDEAPGVKSIWLKPNGRFKGFRPGQHVLLELEINGARHSRCFSFSNALGKDGLIRITIKQKTDGPVSGAAHALQIGQIVRLSQAQGEFAPRSNDSQLLLLSAGSGVTPMMSLLQATVNENSTRDVVIVHCGRTDADVVFANELQTLATQSSNIRVYLHTTETNGHVDADLISQLVPDWNERETLLCGPDGFMQTIEKMYADAGRSQFLQSESFGRRAAPIDPDAAEHMITRGDTEQVFTVQAGQNLLDGAEAAGLQPKFGCRRGICRTCQCLKRSGTVTNVLTGQISGPGEELIQLCISTPNSALDIVL